MEFPLTSLIGQAFRYLGNGLSFIKSKLERQYWAYYLLKQLGLESKNEDFATLYVATIYNLINDKQKRRSIIKLFEMPKVSKAFETELYEKNNWTFRLTFDDHLHTDPAFRNLKTIHVDIDKELSDFRDEFMQLVNKSRAPKEVESHQNISSIMERVNSLQAGASKNALIIMELENIKEKYIESRWEDKGKALRQIFKFSDHSNHRIALEVFNFLQFVAAQTRAGLTNDAISSVLSLILEFTPESSDEFREQVEDISKIGIQIGDNIVYDAAIHLRDLEIAMYGLTILKFFYRSAKKNQRSELLREIDRTYNELEVTLSRPERNDLGNAIELVGIFKRDLDNPDLSFPPLPDHLMKAVGHNRKTTSRIKHHGRKN